MFPVLLMFVNAQEVKWTPEISILRQGRWYCLNETPLVQINCNTAFWTK